jgi:kynurenine formamidase
MAVDTAKLIDLTYTFDASTIGWPGEPPFAHRFDHYGLDASGHFYAIGSYTASEHIGTHIDAPIHFNRHGRTLEQLPLSAMIGPAAVIDFAVSAEANQDALLGLDDIKRWEAAHGVLPPGAIVVARCGWGRFWPDRQKYLGLGRSQGSASSDDESMHFPGFALEAVDFLLEQRDIAAIAIDTASLDSGVATDYPVHRRWLGADKPGFENLANTHLLPETGATIFCIPMKIGQGTGGPARIFALLP